MHAWIMTAAGWWPRKPCCLDCCSQTRDLHTSACSQMQAYIPAASILDSTRKVLGLSWLLQFYLTIRMCVLVCMS